MPVVRFKRTGVTPIDLSSTASLAASTILIWRTDPTSSPESRDSTLRPGRQGSTSCLVSRASGATSAAVRRLSAGIVHVQSIRGGIAPSPHVSVGLNVIRAIAGYAGQRIVLKRRGQMAIGRPFTESLRFVIAVPGRIPLASRRFSLVDVPDLRALADLWPDAKDVWMGAAPLPVPLHWALIAFAWQVRIRVLPSLSWMARAMHFVTNHVRWGEHRGGMFVEVRGEGSDWPSNCARMAFARRGRRWTADSLHGRPSHHQKCPCREASANRRANRNLRRRSIGLRDFVLRADDLHRHSRARARAPRSALSARAWRVLGSTAAGNPAAAFGDLGIILHRPLHRRPRKESARVDDCRTDWFPRRAPIRASP